MTRDEYERGQELQGYKKTIVDMTLGDIALKFLKEHHLPKFLKRVLVKFAHPLLLLKDIELKDLEKENAKLEERLELKEETMDYQTDLGDKYAEQLAQAKEIIKNLLILKNDHYGNTKMEWRVKVTEQAEQFLKEIEK